VMGGFFYKARHQIWRTYDLFFFLIFLGSFIVDMVMLADYDDWQDSFSPATTMYRSMDGTHLSFRVANRYRAGIIAIMTLRFLVLGSFSLSRLTTIVFARLLCIYVLLGILLVPFVCSLTLLVMVLEQGSPIQVVSFGNALRDIMLIVTGVTDRLTAATPRVGRQSGWSVVFYLFLITFVWVMIVPTLIAWAVVVYENAVDYRREREERRRASSESNEKSLEKALTSSLPPSQPPAGGPLMKRYTSDTEGDREADKSAVQILWEGSIQVIQTTWMRIKSWRRDTKHKTEDM
jgi:hypothetical protein